jgi:HEAT repeat protein
VAALRERPALPILVKATTAKDVTVRRAAFWLLSKWIYDTYHADREACASLGAMLPVFIDALAWIRDDSLPNIRSNCFQAIGCLAGPEWIDFVADLGRSRHGAVEHWASWALGQLRSRQPPTQPQPASP